MKNFPGSLIALVAVLALSASGVAFAQQDMGNLSGATYVVGVVESVAPDSVTLVLASGERQTILLADHTVGKKFLVNGGRARIDFLMNDQGKAVANEIQFGGGDVEKVAAAPVIETPTVRVETTAPVQTYRAEPTARVEVEPRATEYETTVTPREVRTPMLPDTASSLPSLALLGLLSFVGAVALRFTR